MNVNYALNKRIASLNSSATLRINELSQKIAASGKTVVRLGLGQSPFPVPRHIAQVLADHAHEKEYLPVSGLVPLREAISKYWNRTQNLDFPAENILIGPGSKELLAQLQIVLRGRLILPQPSWVSYYPQSLIAGNEIRWLPSSEKKGWSLDLGALERILGEDAALPSILLINFPNNPTSLGMGLDVAVALARLARQYGLLVISDEIYGDLDFDGGHQSFARWYPEGTIVSSGLSKWCGAGGWRLGQMAFPSELAEIRQKMTVIASETFTSVSSPTQYAAVEAYTASEETEKYLFQCRRLLRSAASVFYTGLTRMGVDVQMAEGGFYLFPNFNPLRPILIKRGIDNSAALCNQLLRDTGVAILPGSDFGIDAEVLCCRLAFVDFDGEEALRIAASEYAGKGLDDAFAEKAFPKLENAVRLISSWCDK
jgi:aspartate aminotransferase